MSEDLNIAVQMAMREKAHRRAVLDLMAADISDVERVVRVLALEAEHQGMLENLRMAHAAVPAPREDDEAANRA